MCQYHFDIDTKIFLSTLMFMFTPQQIRSLRISLDMTPTVFAALVGVSENTVRRWEIGDRHPNYKRMEALNALAKDRGVELEGTPA